MPAERDELRDELLVILAAQRELTPDADEHLADAFLNHLEERRRLRRRLAAWWSAHWSGGPLSISSIGAIGVVEAAVMIGFDHLLIDAVSSGPYDGYNTPIHLTFLLLWLTQVVITVVLLHIITAGTRRRVQARRHTARAGTVIPRS